MCVQAAARADGRAHAHDATRPKNGVAADARARLHHAIGANTHALFEDGIRRNNGGGMRGPRQRRPTRGVEPLRHAGVKQIGVLADDQHKGRPSGPLGFQRFGHVGRDDDRPRLRGPKLALVARIGQESDFLATCRRQGPNAADLEGLYAGRRADTPVHTLGIGGAQQCFKGRRASKIQ
ncbi:hypothetical protein D3C72_1774830 [compost metagenome]